MAPTKTTFVGGKLSFKGEKSSSSSKKKKKKKSKHDKKKHKHDSTAAAAASAGTGAEDKQQYDDLTDAERKSLKYKLNQQTKELEKVVELTHRERVEKFNEELSQLTEHNDIPRVSAAGNG